MFSLDECSDIEPISEEEEEPNAPECTVKILVSSNVLYMRNIMHNPHIHTHTHAGFDASHIWGVIVCVYYSFECKCYI